MKTRKICMGIATIMVFLFHVLPMNKIDRNLVQMGILGVDIFALCMGISFCFKMKKEPIVSFKDYIQYCILRFIRLYIPFFISVNIESLIKYICFHTFNLNKYISTILLYGIMKQSLYYWYVLFALFMSFILPILYKINNKITVLILSIFLSCALPYPLLSGRILVCVCGLYYFELTENIKKYIGYCFPFIVLITYIVYRNQFLQNNLFYMFGSLFAIGFVCLMETISKQNKVIETIGNYSYEVYLTVTWLVNCVFFLPFNIVGKYIVLFVSTTILVLINKKISTRLIHKIRNHLIG